MNGVALFAGIAGLDTGLNFILPDSRTVCYVEGETYAATLLSKKMRQGKLVDAPIYSNVKTFASVAHVFSGKVDFITAGFPCQPFSTAGDRKGTSDERWLWFDIMDIIGVLRPNFLFLENVANLLNDKEAFSTILRTLAEVGYCIEWATLKASDVGANHQRNRLFIFAFQRSGIELLDGVVNLTHPNDLPQRPKSFNGEQIPRSSQPLESCCGREANATDSDKKRLRGRNTLGKRKQKTGSKVERRIDDTREGDVTDSDFIRPIQTNNWRSSSSCSSRENIFTPKENRTPSWWQSQPDVRRVDDGVPFGMDRLRGLGNAVVPLQAANAFYHLIQRGLQS